MSTITSQSLSVSSSSQTSLWQYVRQGGPGWLQGAMTLGGGSAITSLTIGAVYGYEFLWVQPVAMLIGCVMLFAISFQTLSTGQKPYVAMKTHVSKSLAMAWAIAALASSIIWGFSHYPLGAGMLEEVIDVGFNFRIGEDNTGARNLFLLFLAVLIWSLCASVVWRHGSSKKVVTWFENVVKTTTCLVIISFIWVILQTSLNHQIDWAAVLMGFVPTSLPTDFDGVTTMMSALGTAVGINMTFVYGYTLLDRGWGRKQRKFAAVDIVLGLVLPYLIVTALISIAAAALLFGGDMSLQGRLSPGNASTMFVQAGMGDFAGRLIFPLGILGMVIGTLVMHMLTCGAVARELWGAQPGTLTYRLSCLLPTPAILGVFLWAQMGPYLILPTSAICGVLLPIAYVGWLLLNNSDSFLGADKPCGTRSTIYNAVMVLCIVMVIASVVYSTLVSLGVIVA